LGLDADIPTVLFFGFVRPYKGLKYLIEAYPLVLARTDAHLLIAGEFWDDATPYLEQIKALGLEERCTVLDQYIPNEGVGDCFAAADLVVLPYVDATQSGIVQLAFGFGVPVVTTKVGGLSEAVEDGVTGLLVDPEDSHALAAAIIRYFEEDLGSDMRTKIQAGKDRFSWEQLVTTIEELALG
jgi:glycosyltransferase involved in cell wall biosynthesis